MVPQLMPAGLLVTVPLADPRRTTERANWAVNVAFTVVLAVSVTVQVPVPLQPPPVQPVKTELALGVAVSVTTVPLA